MKCILSFRVAKHLLAQGFRLVDIEQSYKFPGNIVFIFEDCDALQAELAKFERKGQR
ncbi:DUF5659 domain-containing protein [Caldifermentibacillus hisashii]|uniref:DUF5659 domain-containing protein n=1 Tax=Caldifermentibacillus hisashii TaxID=996558 RepID=UPI002E006047|nr:DUF5659 domain-containing protein [Caldifermentibacillus hisashii]MED4851212.1 DUF5659 domain-containing protein [Caldifermentibacillus hisashii]